MHVFRAYSVEVCSVDRISGALARAFIYSTYLLNRRKGRLFPAILYFTAQTVAGAESYLQTHMRLLSFIRTVSLIQGLLITAV